MTTDKKVIENAYLTDKDVKILMNNNQLQIPFVLIEASENSKVECLYPDLPSLGR